MLLKSELLGVDGHGNGMGGGRSEEKSATSPARNLFRYKIPRQTHLDEATKPFSLSPVGSASRVLLSSPRKAKRKIAKVPFKVLDAPALQDDFYLNLVDWSALNVLAVGLGSCVYLWSACTSKVRGGGKRTGEEEGRGGKTGRGGKRSRRGGGGGGG
jgi:cell division cycle 20-like protein 1 (cofactor of APC complex)